VSRNRIKTKYGSSDLDVEGPNGEYIGVGGPAKGHDKKELGKQLKILKEAADVAKKPAQYYLDAATDKATREYIESILGKENVFEFQIGFW
jgi:hypothetical protein